MKLGIIGLGRMGAGIAHRVATYGHDVVGFDPAITSATHKGLSEIVLAKNVAEVAQQCRIIWLMIPAGALVDEVIKQLKPHLKAGDILVDGGNSNFHDSIRRAQELAQNNIYFLDCGTSGGIHGLEHGFCLMVGGNKKAYDEVVPLFKAIATPHGFGYMGKSGSGHYVKMVHNGIEYGLMQAYAEGFELLKEGYFKDDNLNLEEITRVWNHGAVIRSWLLELSHTIFKHDQDLKNISGAIEESGTGQWTVDEAKSCNVEIPVIEKSLEVRRWSRQTGGNFATKVVALLRNAFGGHNVKKIE
ncbi:6-phosphogluconate dehydrogenase [Candidatus Dependentiae bacterium Noda2021]|nr:6-phosphogluconate dehydrogenase [Candidatus Dependentiae bacterium Noda2021]